MIINRSKDQNLQKSSQIKCESQRQTSNNRVQQSQIGLGLQCQIDEQSRKEDKFRACVIIVSIVNNKFRSNSQKFFRQYKPLHLLKLPVLRIFNQFSKRIKKQIFIKIKQKSQKHRQQKHQEISTIQKPNDKTVYENDLKQFFFQKQFSVENIKNIFDLIKQDMEKTKQKSILLQDDQKQETFYRRSHLQELVIKIQQKQIKQLKYQVQFLNKRQERENDKKKQSLQMLAEELEQKNQLISELRKTIKNYQLKLKIQSDANILEDEIATMRKQIDNFQRIRQRLQTDLFKTREVLLQKTDKLKEAEEKIITLQKSQQEFQNLSNEIKIKNERLQKMINIFENLTKSLELKSKKFNFYVSQLQNGKIEECKNGKEMKNQTKLQVMLKFLDNISPISCQLLNLDIFTEDQAQILCKHQQKWNELHRKAENEDRICSPKEQELSGIIFKGTGKDNHTIFQVFESEQVQKNNNKFTTKLLQLQLDKKKQFEKISELKQKILHIRMVVLNLIKCVQIEAKNPQVMGVLQIVFDLFEYSQAQRESIVPKKKKMFGFI